MPTIIVKAEPELDLYIAWSTNIEAPLACGNRAYMLDWAIQDWRRRQGDATPDPISDPAARLARADATGTSATGDYAFFGAWNYRGFIYEQRGVLPRHRLRAAVEAWERDDEPAVWDLLVPFEDKAEVRRG